jgi:hypothetical protein
MVMFVELRVELLETSKYAENHAGFSEMVLPSLQKQFNRMNYSYDDKARWWTITLPLERYKALCDALHKYDVSIDVGQRYNRQDDTTTSSTA